MIIFYEGVPGSGKSYDAVVKIVANLRRRRPVYTNIEGIGEPKCKEMIKCLTKLDDFDIDKYLHILSKEDVFHFWDIVQPGSMVVIDEMQKFFNSRDWQKEENRQCADWCSTHRHEGYDALFLTQRIEKVDTQVRTLTEWTYRYKKVNFLGGLVNKSYVCFAYSGDDTNTPMTKIVRRYDKQYFACYKSYVSKDVQELGIQKHANILKHPIFYIIPIALIATIYFGVSSARSNSNIVSTVKKSAFISKDAKQAVKTPAAAVAQKADPAVAVPVSGDKGKIYSFVGSLGDRVVVEDRSNGHQVSLFDLIGKYSVLEFVRNEFVTVATSRGEIYTFTADGRFRPGDREQAAGGLALSPGRTNQERI